jgi:hypothetical protein
VTLVQRGEGGAVARSHPPRKLLVGEQAQCTPGDLQRVDVGFTGSAPAKHAPHIGRRLSELQ